jgi:hypothetical protein
MFQSIHDAYRPASTIGFEKALENQRRLQDKASQDGINIPSIALLEGNDQLIRPIERTNTENSSSLDLFM